MTARRVVTIGNFDGVHLGHQAILRCARSHAHRLSLPLLALTFDPHPATILRPAAAPPRLMTLDAKQHALLKAGADEVIVLSPSPDILERTPDAFVDWLMDAYQPAAIVEGHDFRFGKDRAGDMAVLQQLGRDRGFLVDEVATVETGLTDMLIAPVRSSVIRWLVGCGRVADAEKCLGRPYALTGKVITGEKRGRTIDIPTANLDPQSLGGLLIPADGVYAADAVLPDGAIHPAAVSIGIKPTFGVHALVIEAHLLDYHGDLYGRDLTLHFRRWVRDQQTFPNIDALIAQLRRDIDQTRRLHRAG